MQITLSWTWAFSLVLHPNCDSKAKTPGPVQATLTLCTSLTPEQGQQPRLIYPVRPPSWTSQTPLRLYPAPARLPEGSLVLAQFKRFYFYYLGDIIQTHTHTVIKSKQRLQEIIIIIKQDSLAPVLFNPIPPSHTQLLLICWTISVQNFSSHHFYIPN